MTMNWLGSGTVFDGDGVVRFGGTASDSFFMCSGIQTLNGTVEVDGAEIGSAVWDGPGLLRWKSGTLDYFTFGPGLRVEMSGAGEKDFLGSCANLGTVRWLDGSSLTAISGGTFNNQGLFILQTNCTLSQTSGGNGGSFTNQGTILAPPGAGTVSLVAGCSFVNQGRLVAETNAVLELRAIDRGMTMNWLGSGTVFDGAGVVRFGGTASDSFFMCSGTQTLNGTVEVDGAEIGSAVWDGPGLLRWKSGYLDYFTFGPGLRVEMSGAGEKDFLGDCANLGTVRWLDGSSLTAISGGTFNNQGLFILQTNCTLSQTLGGFALGSFTNQGTILAPAGGGTVSLVAGCSFVNQGRLVAETNAVLELRAINRGMTMNWLGSGTVFDGDGVVRFGGTASDSFFICSGIQTLNGTVEVDGAEIGSAVWDGPGLLRWKSGTLDYFTFGPGLQVEMSGAGEKDFLGNCANLGTVRWLGDSTCMGWGGATFANSGLFLVETNGNWDPAIAFNNLAEGTVRQTAGRFSLGTLTNSGVVDFIKGFTTLSGAFVPSPASSYRLALGGRVPGQDFGQLNAQSLTAGGSLSVTLTNGFVPVDGDSFTIATGTSGTAGRFTSTSLPALASNLTWRVQYAPDAITLRVASPTVLSGATRLADGSFQFLLPGLTNCAYEIQVSTNLVDWMAIQANTNAPGAPSFTDTNAWKLEKRFYRCHILE
jgi:hypothetical protein